MISRIETPMHGSAVTPPSGELPAGGAPSTRIDGNAGTTLEGGSYDVIRRRLLEQAAELAAKAEALNDLRKKVFGGTDLTLIANERVRTEHNCIARDIASVAGHLLFGFQVFMGLTDRNARIRRVCALPVRAGRGF
jgi:hypothetical protein